MPEVPKVFHFVTTAQSATAGTASRVKRWVAKNPGWKAIVWCDPATMGANHAVASAQDPNVEVKPIDANSAPGASTSTSSASDTTRLAILQKYGGCCVDTEVEPGDPLPTLSVSDTSALWVRATPGKQRNPAIACTIGSQRIKSLLTQTVTANTTQLDKQAAVALDAELPDKCFNATNATATTA
jgi:hypothetical protein